MPSSTADQDDIVNKEETLEKIVIQECAYINNVKEGPCKKIYENGDISQCIYKNGSREGLYKLTCANGDVSECFYKNGKQEGPKKWTYADKKE